MGALEARPRTVGSPRPMGPRDCSFGPLARQATHKIGTINEGKGRLKSSTWSYGLSEGIMGQGLATTPPPSPHAYSGCRSTMEGLGALGEVSAPSTLPRPRRGVPERPVGADVAPDPCEAPSPLSSALPPHPPHPMGPMGGGGAEGPRPEERAMMPTSRHWH